MIDKGDPHIYIDKLDKKIEKTGSDIKGLDKVYIKASEVEKHYATKYFCGVIVLAFFVALCTAYIFVTPLLIESKNSKLSENVDHIMKAVDDLKVTKKP